MYPPQPATLAGPCLVLALAVAAGSEESPAAWQPAEGPLSTRWAKEVTPEHAHPEYPRPQMVRERWLSLNGLWDCTVTDSEHGLPEKFDGRILVPFPIESALSGVMRRLDEHSTLWYRRAFSIPPAWSGQRILLHFGAVDWEARIWVNGYELAIHRGGYAPFSLDVTASLRPGAQQEVVVAVKDPTEDHQPRGKQSRKPEGIFYTPSSGIWQSVWLEPVPPASIAGLELTPDPDASALRLRVSISGDAAGSTVEATALAAGREVGRVTGAPGEALSLAVSQLRLWSPDDPFLYDLRVELRRQGGSLDHVGSYFGMRKVGVGKDARGVTRLLVNGRFLFQIGMLDQGFWPDGLYTAPSDDALRYDLEVMKRLGFNLVRKHVKVEPDRWYYWCDRLGLLVWQDMPSASNDTEDARREFEAELQAMVTHLHNHPSILMWVLFNEGWGQYDTERLVRWVKELDPSRLVSNASGWTDRQTGDVIDMHNYPGPGSPAPEASRAAVLGEFGGLGLPIEGHRWAQRFWGYQATSSRGALTRRYVDLLRKVHRLKDAAGLSAAVYTQTTDVETECNGLLTYDRAVVKPEESTVAAANRGSFGGVPRMNFVLASAEQQPAIWRYTLEKPNGAWSAPGYADAGWKSGPAGFGTTETPGTTVRTTWNTGDIWLRREFQLDQPPAADLYLWMHHDEDAEVYLNGVLAARAPGYTSAYDEVEVSPAAAAALKTGRNLIAIHCHQTSGGQYIDAGLITLEPQLH